MASPPPPQSLWASHVIFNCSSNLFCFSLAAHGEAAASTRGVRLLLEMGTAFKMRKEASAGLRMQCSQALFSEVSVEGLSPVQCAPVARTSSGRARPPFFF